MEFRHLWREATLFLVGTMTDTRGRCGSSTGLEFFIADCVSLLRIWSPAEVTSGNCPNDTLRDPKKRDHGEERQFFRLSRVLRDYLKPRQDCTLSRPAFGKANCVPMVSDSIVSALLKICEGILPLFMMQKWDSRPSSPIISCLQSSCQIQIFDAS